MVWMVTMMTTLTLFPLVIKQGPNSTRSSSHCSHQGIRHCKGCAALSCEIGRSHLFWSSQSHRTATCHCYPSRTLLPRHRLIICLHHLVSPHVSFFILPSISQFIVPCLVIFSILPPLLDVPRCSSHSDFGVTTFQDHLSAVSNCDTDSLKPSLLASCFLHHPSTIHSFCHLCCVLQTLLVFRLGRSTSCLL